MASKTTQEHIKLNVGGIKYETTLNTMISATNSMLANMFSGRHPMKPSDDGYYFIDRDGDIFRYIIKYLRDKKLNMDNIDLSIVENIKDEAEYFQIEGLIDLCDKKMSGITETEFKSTTQRIFNDLIKFDIKAFEKDFNYAFNIDELTKYYTSNTYNLSYCKIDTTNPAVSISGYKNIPKNFKGEIDYVIVCIPIYFILDNPSYYKNTEKIIEIAKKWTDMFPIRRGLHTNDIIKRVDNFNTIVNLQVFNTPYIKVSMDSYDPESSRSDRIRLKLSIRI